MTSPESLDPTTTTDTDTLIALTTTYVRAYMRTHDSSHDFTHIRRVLALATAIACSEPHRTHPPVTYNRTLITLSALLHDVGDSKYLTPAQRAAHAGQTMVRDFLLSAGASAELAETVQRVVGAVSFSREVRDPEGVRGVVEEVPEAGVVQDADRLDALGGVGVGRCFTFGAGRAERERLGGKWDERDGEGMGKGSMIEAMEHFTEKLEGLEGMMKTETGREMARVRTERLRVFRGWWEEEWGIVEGDGLEC